MTYTVAQLMELKPGIAWNKPLVFQDQRTGKTLFFCRVCVANWIPLLGNAPLKKPPHTLASLTAKWPDIEWQQPLPVQWSDKQLFACRVCIANDGLNRTSTHQWASMAEAERHIVKEHGKR
jgi:hypothetical protein